MTIEFKSPRNRPLTIETCQSTDELAELVHSVIAAHGIKPNMSWDELQFELLDLEGTKSLRQFLSSGIERWEVLIKIEDERHAAQRRASANSPDDGTPSP